MSLRERRMVINVNIDMGVKLTAQEIQEVPVFQDWVNRLDFDWQGEVTIHAVDAWGGKVHMILMTVIGEGNPWPIKVILRSETVDILSIVTDGIQQWVVFVEQDRDAAGGRVFSNPAGGKEWSETAIEAATRELEEELGLSDISIEYGVELAFLVSRPGLASPGITNERAYMMRAVITVAPEDLEVLVKELRNKETGVTAEGEKLTLTVLPVDDALGFIEGQQNPDLKTLLSLERGLPL